MAVDDSADVRGGKGAYVQGDVGIDLGACVKCDKGAGAD
jgi:hypothetical protein